MLRIKQSMGYYWMFLPVAAFIIIMKYWPMLGIRWAFFDYKPIGQKNFVGFAHFSKMFQTEGFWTAFRNTLELSIVKLIITTLASVVVSVFLNEMVNIHVKKTVQTVIYLPHFMSWAVVAAIFSLFFISFKYRYGKRYLKRSWNPW